MSDLQALQKKVNYDKTFDCVQCGYCLPACPTYETMETETHSPRGRINLVKMVAEGKAAISDLKEPIEKCLGCMACVTVCPTNVQYGQILEGAKEAIEDDEVKTKRQEKVEQFLFGSFFPSSRWMDRLGNATWLYQASGLQRAARKMHLTSMAPLNLDQFEQVLPAMPRPKQRKHRKTHIKPAESPKATIAFFKGCVMDSMFFDTNERTLELLRLSGAEVMIEEEQTCCGALHAHDGKADMARELAKQNIQAFERIQADYIVNNAGGCGAKLVEYDHFFEEGSEWHNRAKQFVAKVKDISEVLVELDGLTFTTPVNKTVTYQPSCHMTNVQRVTEPPRELMNRIPGMTLQELDRPSFCCGSAGIYNIVNYEDSMEVLDIKMRDVRKVNPHVIVTTNPGCLLQMKLGIERDGDSDRMEAVHLVDLLAEAGPAPK
ncbi:(Fe-S)-binding protein [Thalassobacillus sp. CUG 92003]|uniref:(Fe-S)-binding protein n=1 Tax=Thalassobacillus sp. CUG 92003 TaxID=2736641 RepID=UPI0015E66801|nr:(Fe-S)-binding protein [Thalassobacillus sp. CUG 92003]